MPFTPPQNQIPDAWLEANGKALHERFLPFLTDYQNGKITAAELCATYILLFVKAWKGKKWQNGPRIDENTTIEKSSVMMIFQTQKIRGVSERAQRALIQWHKKSYRLQLHFHTPTAEDVLQIQAQGERVVTLFVEAQEMCQKQFGRDPMTFILHDLEHADEFFHDTKLYHEQKKFYAETYQKLKTGFFDEALKNTNFKNEFEYVIADMNSHPEHLRVTLDFLLKAHTENPL